MSGFKAIDPALLMRFAPAAMQFQVGVDNACDRYQVNTPARISAFLAQWAEETRGFTKLHEVFDYTPEALLEEFKSHMTPELAAKLGRQDDERYVPADRQALIANIVYANRHGNGDAESGDGSRYRGRGWPQLTFKDNYAAYAKASGDPQVITNPGVLELEHHAVGAAGWYWDSHGLNALADRGDFKGITLAVHGCVDHSQVAREMWWNLARTIWRAP